METSLDSLSSWYLQLSQVKSHLLLIDPKLKLVFDTVDNNGFKLHTIIKKPYPALIAAIIGQKISYTAAKNLRSQLYLRLGTDFTPHQIMATDLSFLGLVPMTIIRNVTEYIIGRNINLDTESGIRSLDQVNGIGPWTIETTLLTSLKNWDLFPMGDKFLQVRMKRLYGTNVDIKNITEKWAPYRSIVTWYLWRWF